MHRSDRNSGFTILEVSVSVALVVATLALSMSGFLYLMKAQQQTDTQNELDVEVQWAIEQLKHDIRLSSLDKMFFFPSKAVTYQAISFPLSRDDDGDGAIDVDGDRNIIWYSTVIYHIWKSSPNQLRITTFDPRNNNLTDEQRQEQLDNVVEHGHGEYAYNGENASTRTIFSNLFTWEIKPRGAVYDGYADTVQRDVGVNLGSCVLTPGAHTFAFQVVGTTGSGFEIGLDSLFVSPCSAPREAEAQLPAAQYEGPAPVRQLMTGGSWDGNHQLHFASTELGQSFELSMDNDRWEETNFDATGHIVDKTTIVFDKTLTPNDFVVQLTGNTNVWAASEQSGDTNGVSAPLGMLRGSAVRVLLKGGEMVDGAMIWEGGAACKVAFRAGSGTGAGLTIEAAYVAECASETSSVPDVVASTMHPLTFSGASSCTITSGGEEWSDAMAFPIDTAKSYLVTYLVTDAAGQSTPWVWRGIRSGGVINSFVCLGTNGPATVEATFKSPAWSTNTAVLSIDPVIAVSTLFVSYAEEGTYTSKILDTQIARPIYNALVWDAEKPTGTQMGVKIRTGDDPGMADAPAWSNLTAVTVSGGMVALPIKRHAQFQLILESSSRGADTPKMRDVALTWTGEERVVDVGGTFTKGPLYGQFELTVDGQKLQTGVVIDLELYKDVRGYNKADARRITSSASIEIMPRNTGL